MLADGNFDSLHSTRLFVRKTQKITLISGLITGFLLTVLWSGSDGLGFLSGVAFGVVNFQLMSVDSYGIIETSPKKARKFIIGRVIIGYAIMFVFLALIATRTDFNIISTFIGLFYLKVILIGGQILEGLKMEEKDAGD